MAPLLKVESHARESVSVSGFYGLDIFGKGTCWRYSARPITPDLPILSHNAFASLFPQAPSLTPTFKEVRSVGRALVSRQEAIPWTVATPPRRKPLRPFVSGTC
jgi:hypothetical protein